MSKASCISQTVVVFLLLRDGRSQPGRDCQSRRICFFHFAASRDNVYAINQWYARLTEEKQSCCTCGTLFVPNFDAVCQTTTWNFPTFRFWRQHEPAAVNPPLCLYMKTIGAKQGKVHFAHFSYTLWQTWNHLKTLNLMFLLVVNESNYNPTCILSGSESIRGVVVIRPNLIGHSLVRPSFQI